MEINKIDPILHIRQNKKMYLGREDVNQDFLATNIADDALVLGASTVVIKKEKGWWIIAADVDWLMAGHNEDLKAIFQKILPLKNAGQNAIRREVLLTAFVDDILTWNPKISEMEVIKGESTREIVANYQSEVLFKFAKRALAFRIKESGLCI